MLSMFYGCSSDSVVVPPVRLEELTSVSAGLLARCQTPGSGSPLELAGLIIDDLGKALLLPARLERAPLLAQAGQALRGIQETIATESGHPLQSLVSQLELTLSHARRGHDNEANALLNVATRTARELGADVLDITP